MQQDMDALNPSVEELASDPFTIPRSPQWPAVEHACLEQNQFMCAACGLQGEGLVQVHHIMPFQFCIAYGRPELEFNPQNLMPLCEGPGTNDHHIAIGHLGDFQHLNPDVRTDITGPWKNLTNAEIEIRPDCLARRKWPTKPVSPVDQNALIALMNQWYGPMPQASSSDLIKQWWPNIGNIAAVDAVDQPLDASDSNVENDMTNTPLSNPSGT